MTTGHHKVKNPRILYMQYTNPAIYPPLEHSSRILADVGWHVLFLGIQAWRGDPLRFLGHPQISVRYLPAQAPGWRQKLHYIWYFCWVVTWVLRWRPQWVYASDIYSAPIAWLLSYLPGLRVIYHEHDSPSTNVVQPDTPVMHMVLWARRRLASRARFIVLPNEQRAETFRRTLAPVCPVFTVWNCPRLDEVAPDDNHKQSEAIIVLYQGSIVPERLPPSVVEALAFLPSHVHLHVIGYETIGSYGYIKQLEALAEQLGVRERVLFSGPLSRYKMLKHSRQAHIGLALMPLRSDDDNMFAMVGASNKVFDYLASGLALLVSDLPSWQESYVAEGYARACNPSDPQSIVSAIRWYLDHPNELREMGERGRQRILAEWNYNVQFAPVLEVF